MGVFLSPVTTGPASQGKITQESRALSNSANDLHFLRHSVVITVLLSRVIIIIIVAVVVAVVAVIAIVTVIIIVAVFVVVVVIILHIGRHQN